MLDSDNVEKLFTFAEMEAAKKKTNSSFYEFPGRIPPDAVSPTAQGGRSSVLAALPARGMGHSAWRCLLHVVPRRVPLHHSALSD